MLLTQLLIPFLSVAAPRMATVPAGVYQPLFPSSPAERKVAVAAFEMDVVPVTNAAYVTFVRAQPQWQRSRVKRLFADKRYLIQWDSDLSIGASVAAQAPVVNVSWFAAKAYCEWRGGRLPYEREWELVAAADAMSPNGMQASRAQQRILAWYGQPNRTLAPVRQNAPNLYGIYDVHGLIWEWVYDYNASLVAEDNRSQGEAERGRYCGAAAAQARDPEQYATFMRLAFRSSLQATYGTDNMGFRCVRELRVKVTSGAGPSKNGQKYART